MKNLHYLKKFVVMVLAAMMTLSTFAMPTFAAVDDAKVTGVEAGAVVTAYQFITQDTNGKWIPCTWVGASAITAGDKFTVTDPYSGETAVYNIKDQTYDTNKKALAILANIARANLADTNDKNDPTPTSFTTNGTEATGKLNNKGAYLVLVDPPAAQATVYKPAVISRDFETTAAGETVDMVANVKKETSTPDKNIITKEDAENQAYGSGHIGGNDCVTDDTSKKGDTLAAGDITQFEVTAQVPAYSDDYFFTKKVDDKTVDVYPVFKVSDTLTHLTLKVNTTDNKFEVMSVSDTGAKIKDVTYEVVSGGADGDTSFVIRITDKAFLKSGGKLSVRYWATLDADAVSGFGNKNNNHVKVEYSTKPGQEEDFTKEEIDTYHHTFDIDGDIYGNNKGKEFIKVGAVDGKVLISEKVTEAEETLPGAVFTLKNSAGEIVAVAESDTDGILKPIKTSSPNYNTYKTGIENKTIKNGFRKLDAGDYVMNEVVAPEGYALNGENIPVKIQATVDNATGKLLAYSVTIAGKDTNTYTWNTETKTFDTTYIYKDAEGKTCGTTDPAVAEASWSTQFENTNVGSLPSTGGMGTVLFTIAGAAIMALALFLLFGGKKKADQK